MKIGTRIAESLTCLAETLTNSTFLTGSLPEIISEVFNQVLDFGTDVGIKTVEDVMSVVLPIGEGMYPLVLDAIKEITAGVNGTADELWDVFHDVFKKIFRKTEFMMTSIVGNFDRNKS